MPTRTNRSFIGTVFGVVGSLWFLIHAVEYVAARYQKIADFIPLPAPLGGVDTLYQALPIWAGAALTATIWLGLLGAVLLLLRDRSSVLVLSLALLTALVGAIWIAMNITLQGQAQIGGIDMTFFFLAQILMVAGLWLYARTAKRYNSL